MKNISQNRIIQIADEMRVRRDGDLFSKWLVVHEFLGCPIYWVDFESEEELRRALAVFKAFYPDEVRSDLT